MDRPSDVEPGGGPTTVQLSSFPAFQPTVARVLARIQKAALAALFAAGKLESGKLESWRAKGQTATRRQPESLIGPPLAICIASFVVAGIGHAVLPLAGVLPLTAGVGISLAAWRWAPPGPSRWLAVEARAPFALGAMVAVTWLVGPLGLILLAWLPATAGAVAIWWRYGEQVPPAVDPPGPFVEESVAPLPVDLVDSPSADLADSTVGRWQEHMVGVGLPGVTAEVVTANSDAVHARLHLTAGSPISRVVGALDRLEVAFASAAAESGIQLPPESLWVQRDKDRADIAHLRIERQNSLAAPRAYPGRLPGGFEAPMRIGAFGDGSPVDITLTERHGLIVGKIGSGKSSLLIWAALDRVRPDTAVLVVDLIKAGADFGPYSPALTRLATSRDQAKELLSGVIAARVQRQDWLAQQGLRDWPASPEHPRLLLIIDEVTGVVELIGPEELAKLVREGRQAGITILLGTQQANAVSLGDALALRRECDLRICMRVTELAVGERVFDSALVAQGFLPHRLGPAGSFLVYNVGEHETARPARTWFTPRTDDGRYPELEALSRDEEHRATPLDRATAAFIPPMAEAGRSQVAQTIVPSGGQVSSSAVEVILDMLRAAGPQGVHKQDLVAAVADLPNGEARSQSWVYSVLGRRATQVDQGSWRLSDEELERDGGWSNG